MTFSLELLYSNVPLGERQDRTCWRLSTHERFEVCSFYEVLRGLNPLPLLGTTYDCSVCMLDRKTYGPFGLREEGGGVGGSRVKLAENKLILG